MKRRPARYVRVAETGGRLGFITPANGCCWKFDETKKRRRRQRAEGRWNASTGMQVLTDNLSERGLDPKCAGRPSRRG
jgi:hypothetical protein